MSTLPFRKPETTTPRVIVGRLLTRQEAMEFLAIRGRGAFNRLAKRHKLPRVEFNARVIRYRLADLEMIVRKALN